MLVDDAQWGDRASLRFLAHLAARIDDLPIVLVVAARTGEQGVPTELLQMLHTTPWLEMRDHWGLTGEEIATATGWAMRTLLADLRSREGRPLAE